MKPDQIQQEILLVATSTFSKRQWCKKDDVNHNGRQDPIDQLEEACWNGLLGEMLPEVLEKPASGGQLYLWHIRQSAAVLQIELGEQPPKLDESFSIDPNFFLPTLAFN